MVTHHQMPGVQRPVRWKDEPKLRKESRRVRWTGVAGWGLRVCKVRRSGDNRWSDNGGKVSESGDICCSGKASRSSKTIKGRRSNRDSSSNKGSGSKLTRKGYISFKTKVLASTEDLAIKTNPKSPNHNLPRQVLRLSTTTDKVKRPRLKNKPNILPPILLKYLNLSNKVNS